MTEKYCVICERELEFWVNYYELPFGYICDSCVKETIEYLKKELQWDD